MGQWLPHCTYLPHHPRFTKPTHVIVLGNLFSDEKFSRDLDTGKEFFELGKGSVLTTLPSPFLSSQSPLPRFRAGEPENHDPTTPPSFRFGYPFMKVFRQMVYMMHPIRGGSGSMDGTGSTMDNWVVSSKTTICPIARITTGSETVPWTRVNSWT